MGLPVVHRDDWEQHQRDTFAALDQGAQERFAGLQAQQAEADRAAEADFAQRAEAHFRAAAAPYEEAQRQRSFSQQAEDAFAAVANRPPPAPPTAPVASFTGQSRGEQGALERVYRDARAAGLDDDGARAAVAVARTEGGYAGAQGDAAIGGCYDAETRVLTRRGFVSWPDVVPEDEFATRRMDGVIEYHRPTALTRYAYAGEMYRLRNRGLDLFVTPNHNILAWPQNIGPSALGLREIRSMVPQGTRRRGIRNGRTSGRARNWRVPVHSHWLGEPVGESPAGAAFLGLYIAEGHAELGTNRVTITQSENARIGAVRRVLAGTELRVREHRHVPVDGTRTPKVNFRITDAGLHGRVRPLGKSGQKHVPRALLNAGPEVLSALLTGLMLGDGHAGRPWYTTASPQLADDVAEIAVKLGYGVAMVRNPTAPPRRDQYRVVLKSAAQYELDLMKHLEVVPDWRGEVYCATVPNHTLLIERGGKVTWCGNSRGTFQFYFGGGMGNAYARSRGIPEAQADAELAADPHAGNAWALGGYLGGAIREGQAKGLSGPALAEYAQRHGQRSVSPERAAANYGLGLEGAPAPATGLEAPALPREEAAQGPPRRAEAVGQFEQGLPYEEAAAICGPVAALAFAQANGRNPDLGEARRMARRVGWTAAGGMNGVLNEQALLERMGVASRLDTDPDFGEIAQDAASGNPVIVSTARHYYFVNGYDPATGKLRVGKTGEARRGGAAWMSAQQIAELDGGINGVLYVDNPGTPAPSVAAAPIRTEADPPPSTVEPPSRSTGAAVGGSFADEQDDPLARYREAPASAAPTFPVPEAVRRGVGALGELAGITNPIGEPEAEAARGRIVARAAERLGVPEEEARAGVERGYDIGTGLAGTAMNVNRGAQAAERAAMPAVAAVLRQWDDPAARAGPTVAQRLEDARTFFVRKLTDRRVDLNQAQREVTRLVGGTLPEDMQVAELSRMNPVGAATLRVQDQVAPAIRAVGDDLPYVNALLAGRGNVDVAAATGNQARAFPGGVSAATSAEVPAQLERTLGAERFKIVSDAADRVVQVNRDLRQLLVDAGRITQETADQWAATHQNYTPTQIIDYLSTEAGLPLSGQGKSLSVRGGAIHALSEAGTERARLSPIAATINNVYQVESLAKQNATVNALRNWVERVPEMAQRFQVVDGVYSGTRAENAVSGWRDGRRFSVVTPFPEMARVLRQEPTATIPVIGPLMQAFKELVTARNPAFLVGNALMDFPAYLIRETARAGGMPQDTARAIGRYAAAVPDAFAGLVSGEFTGPATARYLRQGGSMESWAQRVRSPADAERYAQELRRSGGIHLRTPADVGAAARALVTGGTFKAIGERIELVPRVAAFRAGEEAGLSPARAVVRGRDVTVDFAEGGTWAKTLNQAIPFLNPALQGGAGLARTVYGNPRGAGMTFALGLVAPALAVEAWNNADEERARAYADVPDYVKDRGLVFMLPGEGGRGVLTATDEKGNPKPQYFALNLRQYAPVVAATRAAGDAAFGRSTRSWSDLLLGAAQQVAPTADFGSLTPLGARTALELKIDRDLYRGSAIATASADERASLLARALAQGINEGAAALGAYPNARPSQVEFAARENLGVVAQLATGASEIATGQKAGSTQPQDVPVLGAFARRVVGGATGQRLEEARRARLDPDVARALHETGLVADVTAVPRDVRGVPLLVADQAAYQERANRQVNDLLRPVLADPAFRGLPPEVKKRVVSAVVTGAKAAAAGETLAAIGDAEVARRLAAARGRKAG